MHIVYVYAGPAEAKFYWSGQPRIFAILVRPRYIIYIYIWVYDVNSGSNWWGRDIGNGRGRSIIWLMLTVQSRHEIEYIQYIHGTTKSLSKNISAMFVLLSNTYLPTVQGFPGRYRDLLHLSRDFFLGNIRF